MLDQTKLPNLSTNDSPEESKIVIKEEESVPKQSEIVKKEEEPVLSQKAQNAFAILRQLKE